MTVQRLSELSYENTELLRAWYMKRICFFSGDITRGGGTESVAVLIANGLAGQGKHEILFLSLVEQQRTPAFYIRPEIRRYHLGEKWIQPGPGYLAVLPKLRRFLREQRVDILVDIDIVLDILSLPVRRGTRIKVVSWGHFSFYFEQESLYRRWILRFGAKRADYCITINEENCRCYEQYLHRDKALRTIYNPAVSGRRQDIVSGSESGHARDVASDSGCSCVKKTVPETVLGERYILWAGRLTEIKGVDYLAETAERVLKILPGWKWLVAGDGELQGWLENFSREHGLVDRLVLLGRVADLEPYYKDAGIFVLTSHSEGLPMCLLEAKSHGLPCVSFDIRTGPGEIIRDGVNGYLVEPYDCGRLAERIVKLASDDSLREQFARDAVLDMEKFDLECILDSWNEVFESLCR